MHSQDEALYWFDPPVFCAAALVQFDECCESAGGGATAPVALRI